jgi:hypothetical protein
MSTVQLTAAADNVPGPDESIDSNSDVLTAGLGDGAVGADILHPIVASAVAMVMMNSPVRVMSLLLIRVLSNRSAADHYPGPTEKSNARKTFLDNRTPHR